MIKKIDRWINICIYGQMNKCMQDGDRWMNRWVSEFGRYNCVSIFIQKDIQIKRLQIIVKWMDSKRG